MHSIKEMFRAGYRPLSNQATRPGRATRLSPGNHPAMRHFQVTPCGNLAITGRGHATVEATRRLNKNLPYHPGGNRRERRHQPPGSIQRRGKSIVGGAICVQQLQPPLQRQDTGHPRPVQRARMPLPRARRDARVALLPCSDEPKSQANFQTLKISKHGQD